MTRIIIIMTVLIALNIQAAYACSPVILMPPPSLQPYQGINAAPIPEKMQNLAHEFGIDQDYVTELGTIYCRASMTESEKDNPQTKINEQIINLIIKKWTNQT